MRFYNKRLLWCLLPTALTGFLFCAGHLCLGHDALPRTMAGWLGFGTVAGFALATTAIYLLWLQGKPARPHPKGGAHSCFTLRIKPAKYIVLARARGKSHKKRGA